MPCSGPTALREVGAVNWDTVGVHRIAALTRQEILPGIHRRECRRAALVEQMSQQPSEETGGECGREHSCPNRRSCGRETGHAMLCEPS